MPADLANNLRERAAVLRSEADELERLADQCDGDGDAATSKVNWWSTGDAVAQGFHHESITGTLTELCACLRVKKTRTLKRMVRDRIIHVAPDVGCRSWALHFRSRERFIAALKIMAANDPQSTISNHKLRLMLQSASSLASASGTPAGQR